VSKKNVVLFGSGQFYASASGKQAKRIAKAHGAERIDVISERRGGKKM
jgi:hypothetical protein